MGEGYVPAAFAPGALAHHDLHAYCSPSDATERRASPVPTLKWASARSERAVEAARRKIARGERPLYRLSVSDGFGGLLEARCIELETVSVLARSRTDVLRTAREEIAIQLGVRDDDFEVAIDTLE
jgi:hypothetical protein